MRVGKTLILVGVSGAILLSSGVEAQERSPVQYSRDGASTLVQKAVNGDEWTITYELETGHVTGNVRSDASSTFLECERVRVDIENGLGEFECHSATGCTRAPCDDDPWKSVGEVELPLSFFLPPEPEEGPDGEVATGCCSFGPEAPCFPVYFPGSGCIGAGGVPRAGTCTVVRPLEDCPEGLDPEFCFVGECR